MLVLGSIPSLRKLCCCPCWSTAHLGDATATPQDLQNPPAFHLQLLYRTTAIPDLPKVTHCRFCESLKSHISPRIKFLVIKMATFPYLFSFLGVCGTGSRLRSSTSACPRGSQVSAPSEPHSSSTGTFPYGSPSANMPGSFLFQGSEVTPSLTSLLVNSGIKE